PIHGLANGKPVLTDLLEAVAAIEPLGSQIFRPHSDVQGSSPLTLQPFEPDSHQTRADTQIVMSCQHIELMNLAGAGLTILYRQLATAHGNETHRRRVGKSGQPDGALRIRQRAS